MKKRILDYRTKIDDLLKDDSNHVQSINWDELVKEHLVQISFFQHERLVHLIVTVLVAILAVMCLGIALISQLLQMLAPAAMLFVLFIPYIAHYYLLENEVQKMYEQYDKMVQRCTKS